MIKKTAFRNYIIFYIVFIILISTALLYCTKDIFLKKNPAVQMEKTGKPFHYKDNPAWLEQTDFYTTYNASKKIVVLGNSLVQYVHWNELLNRNDVANRGIGSDITQGYLHRIRFITNLKPAVVFIEGGVNDLARNIHIDTVLNNLALLADTIAASGARPVLTSVLYTGAAYTQPLLNNKIRKLNHLLRNMALSRKYDYINLNPLLSDGRFLKPQYVQSDGIHLTAAAYLVWKIEIEKLLVKYNI